MGLRVTSLPGLPLFVLTVLFPIILPLFKVLVDIADKCFVVFEEAAEKYDILSL